MHLLHIRICLSCNNHIVGMRHLPDVVGSIGFLVTIDEATLNFCLLGLKVGAAQIYSGTFVIEMRLDKSEELWLATGFLLTQIEEDDGLLA